MGEVTAALHQHFGPNASVGAAAVKRGFWYTEAPRHLWEQLAQNETQIEILLPGGQSFGVTNQRADGTPVQRQVPKPRPPPAATTPTAKRPRMTEPNPHITLPAALPLPTLRDIQYRALPAFPWRDFLRPHRELEPHPGFRFPARCVAHPTPTRPTGWAGRATLVLRGGTPPPLPRCPSVGSARRGPRGYPVLHFIPDTLYPSIPVCPPPRPVGFFLLLSYPDPATRP